MADLNRERTAQEGGFAFTAFTDSLVVSMPSDDTGWAEWVVCYQLGKVAAGLLRKGILSRGGIIIGALHHRDGVVLGSWRHRLAGNGRVIALGPMLLVTIAAAFLGCTTIPGRFTRDPLIGKDLGYVVENEDERGFNLEIFYHEFSFVPSTEEAIQSAKKLFVTTAERVAAARSKAIRPVNTSELKVNSTRNIIDSRNSVYVSGWVQYR